MRSTAAVVVRAVVVGAVGVVLAAGLAGCSGAEEVPETPGITGTIEPPGASVATDVSTDG